MRRALLIGCQTEGLVGVHADLEAMAGLLKRYAFDDVVMLRDEAADRYGILLGIERLIERSAAGDAVVLYYSGHGWRIDAPASATAGRRSYQGICPWDLRSSGPGNFRGILAEELSALLARLTEKTDNATVILDCCHATGIVRDDASTLSPVVSGVRGLSIPWVEGGERCLADLRARGLALERRDPECNPLAVRLLACRPHERAYEDGDRGGVLTRVLVAELAAAGHAEVVWEDLARRVVESVRARRPGQHPVALGPVRRLVFRSDSRGVFGATACVTRGGRRFLVGGAMAGQRVGDRYVALPLALATGPVRRDGAGPPLPGASARLEVIAVRGDAAEVRSDPDDASLPDGTTAVPVRWDSRAAVTVAVRAAWRSGVVAALTASGLLRVDASAPTIGGVEETPGGLVAFDTDGHALTTLLEVASDVELDAALAVLVTQLEAVAQAEALRGLRSAAPLDPDFYPFELAWYTVDGEPRPLAPGSQVRPDTRITVCVRNCGGWTVYVTVLRAGPGGRVELLSRSQPGGVALAAGESYWLGEPGLTGVEGVRLGWPEASPDARPRRVTLVTIVADRAVDLRSWETGDRRDLPADRGEAPGSSVDSSGFTVAALECIVAPRGCAYRHGSPP